MARHTQLQLDQAIPEKPPVRSLRGFAGRLPFGAWMRRAPNVMERLGGGLLYWAPVWIAAIFVAQIVRGGWLLGLAEERRLDAAEFEVQAFEQDLAKTAAALAADERRLADPIYRERVRRSQATAGTPTLLLETPGDS